MTHTQIVREQLQQAEIDILQAAGISLERYNHIMFYTGCAFAEDFIQSSGYKVPQCYREESGHASALLTNPSLGFWNWWRYNFKRDDAAILKYYNAELPDDYQELKEAMVGDPLFIQDLHYTLPQY